MSFHRDSGHPRARHGHRHGAARSFAQAVPEADSDDFGPVRSWLNQTSPQDEVANHQDSFNRDLDHSHSSGWRPYNLPIAPIPLHKRQQGERSFDRDQPISRSPERFDNGSYSTTRGYEGSVAMGSDKENRKRHWSPERQQSPNFTSDDFAFERRPRRKTRPDRYDSRKRDDGRMRTARDEVKEAKKQTRSKKSRLRSSRDVMDNFTSSFLGSSRITLDPQLRLGMSVNARSSAFAGREIGDLRSNEMRFLERPEEPPKEHGGRNNKDARRKRIKNGFERHLVQPSSSRQSTPALSTINSRSVGRRTKATRPQETKSKSPQDDLWGARSRGMSSESCCDSMPDKSLSLPQRDRSGSANQTVSAGGSKTPECVTEELIETRVFGGTEFLSRLGHRREQLSTETDTNGGTPDPAETSKAYPRKRASYQDRGVMVSPGMEKSERSNQELPVTVDHNHQGTAAGASLSINPSALEQQPEDLSMPSRDPNRVQVIDDANTSETPYRLDSGDQVTGDKEHQAFAGPVPTQADKVSNVEKHPESISETSEGGHHYIRSANRGLDLGIGPESSLWKARPPVQPLPQRFSTPQSWEHATGHPKQYGWQGYQNTPAPPSALGTQYPESLYPRMSTLTPIPTPHPARPEPLNHKQDRFAANENDPRVARQYNDEETMMEFIERIENEVMTRWDQPQDSYGVAMGSDNFEDGEIARPASKNSQPILQQWEPSVQGPQDSFVDWDNPLGAPRRFSGRTATDEDCAAAEAEMHSFWRPNRL